MNVPQIGGDRSRRSKVKPAFGYRHYLKTMFKKGLLPTVKFGIYGSPITSKNVSLEHLVPHSQGGASSLKNYALATQKNNQSRDTLELKNYIKKDTLKKYLDQFKDLSVSFRDNNGWSKFNGNRYIQMIKSTLSKLGVETS